MLGWAFLFACYLTNNSFEWMTIHGAFKLVAIVFVQLIIFLKFGLYRAVLRYASIDFLMAVLKGGIASTLGMLFVLYIAGVHLDPRTLIIDWLLTVLFVGGSRFCVRYYQEFIVRYRKGRRVLIYGAGDLGVMVLRQLKQNNILSYVPVGFIDDNVGKSKKVIHSKPVLGGRDDLDNIISKYSIDEVVIAISNLSGEALRRLVKDCRNRNVMCRIVPSFTKVLEMEPIVRDIEISDLLRRSPRDLDLETISQFLRERTILITGAAGSIGSELVRQCMRHNPKEIIAVDQSEEGLYHLQEEFCNEKGIKCVLADVISTDSIYKIFDSYRPNIVFHAAAYKHVPMLERNAPQAVINNIGGTRVVATASDKYGVEKFVLISTDKAVRPSSVMGATKRVCELFIQNFNKQSRTEFVAVRFGNVLGSSGSVVPKFIDQIRSGGPVTVTHPETTRYFMLTSEAVQLVLQAATIGNNGNIFILDMGSPVKIVEMAEDLIYLMGKKPHKEVEIKFTGLRPGEKIHEELFSEEIDHGTQYENITVAKAMLMNGQELDSRLDELVNLSIMGDTKSVLKLLNYVVKNSTPEVGRLDKPSSLKESEGVLEKSMCVTVN